MQVSGKATIADQSDSPESGMELRDLLSDTEFLHRPSRARGSGHETDALRRLVRVLAGNPESVLQELVDIAVQCCGADSAGISLEETDPAGQLRFRWIAISGSFAQYLNGTTPRFFSPCGTCLSRGRAQLYRVTKPYYDFLGVTAEPITDGMLIPWIDVSQRGTIWAVAHHSAQAFDLEDYRLLSSLADFALIAVRHQEQEKSLRQKEQAAASAAKANLLAHRINNPLQSLTNAVYLAREDREQRFAYLDQASRELDSLSHLVSELLALKP